MKLIKLIPDGTTYVVKYCNGVSLGTLIRDVDGFWKFFPELKGGYWESEVLGELADTIDKMNEDWYKHLKENL